MAGCVILNKLSEIVITHSGTPVYTVFWIKIDFTPWNSSHNPSGEKLPLKLKIRFSVAVVLSEISSSASDLVAFPAAVYIVIGPCWAHHKSVCMPSSTPSCWDVIYFSEIETQYFCSNHMAQQSTETAQSSSLTPKPQVLLFSTPESGVRASWSNFVVNK